MLEKKNKDTKRREFKEVLEKFKKLTQNPAEFLTALPEKSDNAKDVLQRTYQLAISVDDANLKNVEILPELVLENMDEEQIWQQLELRNKVLLPQLIEQTAQLVSLREKKLEIRLKEDDKQKDNDEEEEAKEEQSKEYNEDDYMLNDEDFTDSDGNFELKQKSSKKEKLKNRKKIKPSIVDDKFFKLNDMKKFLEQEDAKDMRKRSGKQSLNDVENDGVDYFAEDFGLIDDDEVSNPDYKEFFGDDESEESEKGSKTMKNYKDYFADDDSDEKLEENVDENTTKTAKIDKSNKNEKSLNSSENNDNDPENEESLFNEDFIKNTKNLKLNNKQMLEPDFDSNEDEDEDEDDNEILKSSHELRQERLNARIREYEDDRLGEKPWQLKGEIQASNRPQNSLLEEVLEFESTVRPAPAITEETTRRLEDIIRQRIKDQAWDDVELKVRPTQTPQEYRKQLVLDQEKSKESLAQIYEKEYKQELAKVDPNSKNLEETEEEPREHKEINRQMKEIFTELDYLFRSPYNPRPAIPELKIITNTPAISMENVAPLAISDATRLAPEEIYRGPKHELVGKSERTRTDKNRERRKKKQKQKTVKKLLEAKDLRRQKLGIPLPKKEEQAKLLKTITKHRNVEKVKIAGKDETKSIKSSKAFFSKLQDATTSTNVTKKIKKKPVDDKTLSAKKVKL